MTLRTPSRIRRLGKQLKGDLDEGIATEVALRLQLFDQLLKGQLGVPVGPDRRLLHPPKQFPKRRIPAHIRPQHQRVDEESDQPFRLCPGPPGRQRPHRDVLLPAVAGEQHLKSRQQRHEQRRVLVLAQLLQRRRRRPVNLQLLPAALIARQPRTRTVRRQTQHFHPPQLTPPVLQLPLQLLALQPLPLPHRVVRILHRQLRQPRPTPVKTRLVQRRQLPKKNLHRPAIRHNVVRRDQQHLGLLRQLQQTHPQQRAPLQVERTPRLFCRQPQCLCFPLCFPKSAQIHHRDLQRLLLGHHLLRLSLHIPERGPQRLVPPNQLIHALLQHLRIHPTFQMHRRRDVVQTTPRTQPVQKPHPLLRVGTGERLCSHVTTSKSEVYGLYLICRRAGSSNHSRSTVTLRVHYRSKKDGRPETCAE